MRVTHAAVVAPAGQRRVARAGLDVVKDDGDGPVFSQRRRDGRDRECQHRQRGEGKTKGFCDS